MSFASLHRFLRRVACGLRPYPAVLVYSGQYACEVPALPGDARRGEHIITFLAMEGLARRGALRWPQPVSIASLARVHSDSYLDSLNSAGAMTAITGLALAPREEDRYLEQQRAMTGGTVLATRLALAGRSPAINLGGGLHHAHADRGEGFCVFNDVAVAIRGLRETGFAERILVLDLDVHDGNGTRSIFASDSTVHTFSIHNQHWGPTEAVASTAIALGDGVTDGTYLTAVREHVPGIVRSFRPGLVYFLAGTDPAKTDALGNWNITPEGMLARDQLVFQEVRAALGDVPLVVLLAGGYGSETWRYSARSFGWLLSGGRVIEPPSTTEIVLRRYRYLASFIDSAELMTDPHENDFGLSERDLLPGTGYEGGSSRFLNFYSAHGLELALERVGFLTRLRGMGFEPHLSLELDDPSGDTLRIFGSPGHGELVVELKVRRDRRLLPGFELLSVEWLLLQNPRLAFTPERPSLPGQKHPGLGLLREVIALLVLACDRLGLDGFVYVPSHYHVAAQSERQVKFLFPNDRAHFEAIRTAVAGLPLGEASQKVARGDLLDPNAAPLLWRSMPMAVPVSERMKLRFTPRAES